MKIMTPNLREVRVRQFMPPSELAKLAGVSVMTVWRLERGGATQLTTVRKLARALGVKPHELAVVSENAPMRNSPHRESTALSVPSGDSEGGR